GSRSVENAHDVERLEPEQPCATGRHFAIDYLGGPRVNADTDQGSGRASRELLPPVSGRLPAIHSFRLNDHPRSRVSRLSRSAGSGMDQCNASPEAGCAKPSSVAWSASRGAPLLSSNISPLTFLV